MWRSVFVPTVALAFAEGLLVPVLPLYVASLGVPLWWVGLVLAGEAIGMLIGDLPAGALLRRMDRKLAMLVGIGLLAAAAGATAFVEGAVAVFALRLVAGLGAALWGISRHAFLVDAVPLQRRGRVIAAFGGATRVGALAGPAVGGVIAVTLGYQAAFLVYAAVAAVTLAFVARAVEPAPPARVPEARPTANPAAPDVRGPSGVPRAPSARRQAWAEIASIGTRTLVAAGAGTLLAQAIRAGRRIVIPLYGSVALGLDVEAIGWILSLASAFDVALFPVAGWVMDHVGRKAAIVPSFAVQALGMALVPAATGFAGLAVAAALIGLGNGLGSGTMMTVGADLAPKRAMGEFLGAWRLIGDGGAMASPVLVGAMADALGLAAGTLAVAVLGFGAAATFAYGVPETGTARRIGSTRSGAGRGPRPSRWRRQQRRQT